MLNLQIAKQLRHSGRCVDQGQKKHAEGLLKSALNYIQFPQRSGLFGQSISSSGEPPVSFGQSTLSSCESPLSFGQSTFSSGDPPLRYGQSKLSSGEPTWRYGQLRFE